MTNKILSLIVAGCLSLGIASCSKDLEKEDFQPSESAVVNSFDVHWRGYMTIEQRQAVTDILNDMVRVEGGIFTMGANTTYDPDARSNETPAHLVKLTDYYICAHELTYDQVQALKGVAVTRASSLNEFKGKYLSYTWEDWQYVLSLLTEFTGIEFAFPSEAQWEFAARGGNFTKGYLYPGSNKWEEVYADDLNSNDDTVPNELGLYNMANRRSEWCADAYAAYTDGPMPTDPIVTIGYGHVVRGGCHISTGKSKNWTSTSSSSDSYSNLYDDIRFSRSTARAKNNSKSWDIGCRPVINIK